MTVPAAPIRAATMIATVSFIMRITICAEVCLFGFSWCPDYSSSARSFADLAAPSVSTGPGCHGDSFVVSVFPVLPVGSGTDSVIALHAGWVGCSTPQGRGFGRRESMSAPSLRTGRTRGRDVSPVQRLRGSSPTRSAGLGPVPPLVVSLGGPALVRTAGRALRWAAYAVVGSSIVVTRLTRSRGNLQRRACSRMSSSLAAMKTQ